MAECPRCGGSIDLALIAAKQHEAQVDALLRQKGFASREDWLRHKERNGRGPEARKRWEIARQMKRKTTA